MAMAMRSFSFDGPRLRAWPHPLRELGVVDVDLVYPHAAPEHDTVLAAPHRGEGVAAEYQQVLELLVAPALRGG